MLKQKKNSILIIVSLIVVVLNMLYIYEKKSNSDLIVKSQIKQPIIELKKDEIIKCQINQNSFPIEYCFEINNFKDDKINEIDFDYIIQIEKSDENFPVSYELFDCATNKKIELVDGKSELMKIKKYAKESKKFKLILNWRELDLELANKVKIDLKLEIKQSEEKI